VTTYSTLQEPRQTFASVAETERHFEKTYLPGLVRTITEATVDGPASRHMHDRVLNKVIENEWNRETKSPSPMMQELAARFREVNLHIFRHRRGMLFVSPVFPRPLTEQQTAVSSQVRTIVEAIGAQPRIGRKELADKLIGDQKIVEAAMPAAEEVERAKLALASDLLWLISAGHVIEFNDGSLDLPRVKTKQKDKEESAEAVFEAEPKQEPVVEPAVLAAPESNEGGPAAEITESRPANTEARVEAAAPSNAGTHEKTDDVIEAVVSTADPDKPASAAMDASTTTEESEIGGS
jgi:hypothetical protein